MDVDAAAATVERLAELARSTVRPEVVGGLGGFGGLFSLQGRHRRPMLVASTDGVGTKSAVAAATGRLSTIGIDLVAMCVDDLVCQGAEPLFLLDYVAVGRLDPAQLETLVAGVAEGCRQAGCALLGGETAEHPGVMAPGAFDLAGFAVGVVEADEVLGPHRVSPGDSLVGLTSPGLRDNGYALARTVLLERAGLALDGPAWPGASHSLADELLAPSVVYAPAVLGLLGKTDVHAVAHVTGGGIAANLARVLPEGLGAVVERAAWEPPRIFSEIARLGPVDDAEMEKVFNLGIGMVVVVARDDTTRCVELLGASGHDAMLVGEVAAGGDGVRLVGAPV